MKRVLPTLVLVLLTIAALAFTYKDSIFPKSPGDQAEGGAGPGGPGGGPGMGRGGGRRARNADPNRVVPILAEAAKTASVPVYLHGVGTVQAYNTATVHAQVSGRLIAVNYREGEDVKKGDVLAQIDPVTYKATYDQAVAKRAMDDAQLANARLDLKRYEGLAKTNYATQQQADTQRAQVAQLEAQVRQDQAAIDSAKANLDYTTIVAPIGGRTGIREVDVGNLVTPSDTNGITVVTQIKPVSVLFTLPETAVGGLVEAQMRGPVALAASVGGDTVGDGALEVIDNRIDQTTGTVKLKGTFPNDSLKLWPGQFVNVRLHLKTLTDVTVVPASAVQQGANGRYVYAVQPDDTVKLTIITVGQEDEKQVVVSAGIKPGDKVATAGFSNLQDGSKVSIGDASQPGTMPATTGDQPQNGRKRRNGGGGGNGGGKQGAPAADAPPADKPASAAPVSTAAPQGQSGQRP